MVFYIPSYTTLLSALQKTKKLKLNINQIIENVTEMNSPGVRRGEAPNSLVGCSNRKGTWA